MEPKKNQPFYIELIGPAGAGKTTLVKSLVQANNNICVAAKPKSRSISDSVFFIKGFVTLLPILSQQPLGHRWLTYREIWWMIFLNEWHCVFEHRTPGQCTLNILDHGPIYMLTSLHEFGPDVTRSPLFEQWWNRMLSIWAAFLDMVIWLDAPDAVLATRINLRSTQHPLKGAPDEAIHSFLSRYRSAFQEVMGMMQASATQLRVLQFQTDRDTLNQIKAQILSAAPADTLVPATRNVSLLTTK